MLSILNNKIDFIHEIRFVIVTVKYKNKYIGNVYGEFVCGTPFLNILTVNYCYGKKTHIIRIE